jgi:hypothetical protein
MLETVYLYVHMVQALMGLIMGIGNIVSYNWEWVINGNQEPILRSWVTAPEAVKIYNHLE